MIEIKVPQGARAMPLARLISRSYPMIPGWAVREAIKNKDVRVNGEKVTGGTVKAGDEVKAYIADKYLDFSLTVLYRDNGLLVVDKPQGLPVDVDYDEIGVDTVLSRARQIDPKAKLCHRLDAGTGGVVILATDDEAYAKALEAFRGHDVDKVYELVVLGQMKKKSGTLVNYLVKDSAQATVRCCDRPTPMAEKAELLYETVTVTDKTSLVRVRLLTGKTHQIRVQFAHAGHPLLGDDKYGDREANKLFKTQTPALWCREIAFNGMRFTSLGGIKCT